MSKSIIFSEIIFGQLLYTFGYFYLVTLNVGENFQKLSLSTTFIQKLVQHFSPLWINFSLHHSVSPLRLKYSEILDRVPLDIPTRGWPHSALGKRSAGDQSQLCQPTYVGKSEHIPELSFSMMARNCLNNYRFGQTNKLNKPKTVWPKRLLILVVATVVSICDLCTLALMA